MSPRFVVMGEDRRVEQAGWDASPDSGDVVESPPALTSRLLDRWAALPRRRKLTVAGPVIAVVGAAAAAFGATEVRSWQAERSMNDQVTLQASIGVSPSSTASGGGRVDFYVSVLNTGPRPVSLAGIAIASPPLRIASVSRDQPAIMPGQSIQVPLSVVLDCPPGAAPVGPVGLRGVIEAVAFNGRARSVDASFEDSALITGIAETICRLRPDLRGLELDGPVLS